VAHTFRVILLDKEAVARIRDEHRYSHVPSTFILLRIMKSAAWGHRLLTPV
jgi:hypothetical protein